MNNSQLILVLRALDKKEQREMRKWLQSPYHNQRDDVVKLYDYLTAANRLWEDKYLDKAWLFRKVYGAQPYDDDKLRQTMHFLLKELEAFLSYQEISKNEPELQLALVRSLRRRKVDKAFLKASKDLQKKLEDGPLRDSATLQQLFFASEEHSTYLHEQRRTMDAGLQASINYLDQYLVAEQLKLACHVLSHQKVYKNDYQLRFIPMVLDALQQAPQLVALPAIGAYYHGYLAQTRTGPEGEAHFFELKQLFIQHRGCFSEEESRNIYLMALNYCIEKMNRGSDPFVRQAFELYEQGLESGVLFQNGLLSRWTYLNITLVALRLREFAWTTRFIPQYAAFVEEEYRASFQRFCEAKLYNEQKQYDQAMQLLAQFDPDDILINLTAKSMLVKMLFETEQLDTLDSLIDSFATYLKRKDVIGYHKAVYQNFVRLVRKLTRINPYDRGQREKLQAEIQAANPLIDRSWLLEQLDKAAA